MKLMRKIELLPMEAVGNIILLIFLLCGFVTNVVCAILNESKIFYLAITKDTIINIMVFEAASLILIAYWVVISKGKILGDDFFKYILLCLVIIWVGINCTFVYFHTTLFLLIPLLISRCFNSSKVTFFAITATLVLIIVTPITAYIYNGMDVTFPMWYLDIINPDIAKQTGDFQWYSNGFFDERIVNAPVHIQILIWIVLPRVMCVAGLIIVAFAGNYANRKSYERQIDHILMLQDSMIDSMSAVIENRDISTGGHVRRTQDNVKILVSCARDEIKMSDEYWEDLIKSAALHDLGKIAISDAILTKPGRLTENEFDRIKIHPIKSKSIIQKILEKEDDELLKTIAENVALYHHEKYDGSGYPEGLKGDDIPLEARIMAIADVYDALVSERCYKKAYSPKEAFEIVKESMGSHFDPKLWSVFEKAVPSLEAYYKYSCDKVENIKTPSA